MAAPDPESFSLLSMLGAAAAVVATPITWAWTQLNKKADKHSVRDDFQTITNEQALHKTYFGKLFEKLDEHSRRDEQLFREVMTTIAGNHAELLRELGRKADR